MTPVAFRRRLAISAALAAVTPAVCAPASIKTPFVPQAGHPLGLGEPARAAPVEARVARITAQILG